MQRWQLKKKKLKRKSKFHLFINRNKEAWDYIYKLISNYVEELDLGCYRQDYNVEIVVLQSTLAIMAGCDGIMTHGVSQICGTEDINLTIFLNGCGTSMLHIKE